MARVTLTRHLQELFPTLEDNPIDVRGDTVAEVVQALEQTLPGFAFYICDERGRLRRHVNIFIGEDRVVDRVRLSDPVGDNAHVFILQALSGG